MAEYAITGDIATLLGDDHTPGDPAALWLEASQPIILDGTTGRVGGQIRVPLNTDGTFTISVPESVDETTPLYRMRVDSLSLRRSGLRNGFTTDWFALTTNRDLTWIVENYIPNAVVVGSGSGSSSLTVVNGGTIDLPNSQANGYLIGYKVTATATIEGVSFAPGTYVFERDTTVGAGWTYRTISAGTEIGGTPDTTAPTAPSLSVNNTSDTQLVATFSGGTDNVAVTQYRTRINSGAWTVGASPRTFTGLTASTSYTIDAQAGDAAGNWSTSTTWTGSTAASDPAPGWTAYDSFTATNGTLLNGRTTVKGSKTWVSPHDRDGGGAPEAASITGNLVSNTNTGALSTQGARLDWGAGNVEVECDYDVSTGADSTANKQVIVTVAAASTNDFLAFQVRANGALVCLKGGGVEPAMSGVTTGLPTTGTVNVKLVGNTVTVTHPAGTATVTVTPGASPGWTNTGTFCGVSARSRTAKFDNVKVR